MYPSIIFLVSKALLMCNKADICVLFSTTFHSIHEMVSFLHVLQTRIKKITDIQIEFALLFVSQANATNIVKYIYVDTLVNNYTRNIKNRNEPHTFPRLPHNFKLFAFFAPNFTLPRFFLFLSLSGRGCFFHIRSNRTTPFNFLSAKVVISTTTTFE